MRHDDIAPDPQEREAPLEVDGVRELHEAIGEPGGAFVGERPGELPPEPGRDLAPQAFDGLQRDVPHEPVAHHHVGGPAHQMVPFDQSRKAQPAALEQPRRFLHDPVALARLVSVCEERHGGVGDPAEHPHVGGADHGKFEEMPGLAVHRRPQVDQERLRVQAEDLAADAGPPHPFQHADLPDRGEQGRSRAPGAYRGVRPPAPRLPHRYRHGRIGGRPQRLER